MSAEGGTRTRDAGGGEVAQLMQLVSGFWVSNVLASAVELGVFGLLDSRPALSADEVAHALRIAARGVRQLLPAGHDTVLLSSVLHNWDPATVATLLAKCHRALLPAGTVIVTELILGDGGAGPPGAALMGLDMLVWTLGGRSYTEPSTARRSRRRASSTSAPCRLR